MKNGEDCHRLYFPKEMTKSQIRAAYRTLLTEQDIESPHRYFDDNFKLNGNDIFFDVGAAEGMIALEIKVAELISENLTKKRVTILVVEGILVIDLSVKFFAYIIQYVGFNLLSYYISYVFGGYLLCMCLKEINFRIVNLLKNWFVNLVFMIFALICWIFLYQVRNSNYITKYMIAIAAMIFVTESVRMLPVCLKKKI